MAGLAEQSVVSVVASPESQTSAKMKLMIPPTVRVAIQSHIAYARAHRCDFSNHDMAETLRRLDGYALNVTNDLRVYYLHHTLPPRVMAHLSLHPRSSIRLDDEIIAQIAGEFHLTPPWRIIKRMEPSVHLFKVL